MSQDPAIFVGVINAEGGIVFDYPTQQKAYCKRKLAGQPVDVTIAPQGHAKSRLQESGFHAMITPWAKEEGHRIDDLKRDLLRAVFGEQEHTNPLTGEVMMVLRQTHTSKLTRADYSELIERTLQLGAECGVVLVAPDEYRRAKEQAMTRQAKKAVTA